MFGRSGPHHATSSRSARRHPAATAPPRAKGHSGPPNADTAALPTNPPLRVSAKPHPCLLWSRVPKVDACRARGMTIVSGGAFRMGSAAFYPKEGPVIAAQVDSLWIDDHPVTNAAFRRFIAGIGHVTTTETARSTRFPRRRALAAGARLAGLHPHGRAGAAARLDQVVALGARRQLAPPRRPRLHPRWQGPAPSGAHRAARQPPSPTPHGQARRMS